MGLLLLGSLRCVGLGLTLDDLEECTAIDEETHWQFFHKFIEHGQDVLFPEFVVAPTNAQDCFAHWSEFECGASTLSTPTHACPKLEPRYQLD